MLPCAKIDRAASRRELPDVCQRQCHQVLRHSPGEQVVAPGGATVVHVVARDAVHAGIGARRDRRVSNGGVRRQKVDLRLSEPGAALAQGGERRHGRRRTDRSNRGACHPGRAA